MRLKTNIVLFVFVAMTFSCELARPRASTNSQDVNQSLTVLIARQRANRDWMEIVGCPIDRAPDKSERPAREAEACAVDPERCLSACNEGDGSSCWALAQLIQLNESLDQSVAFVLFEKSCRLGIASGCTNYGAMETEQNNFQTTLCAARAFEYACEKADPWGCSMHGEVLGRGLLGKTDLVGARAAFDRACEISADQATGACPSAKESIQRLLPEETK